MSTKLKINIILLLVMAVSTGYFLHLIDGQERIITQYDANKDQVAISKFNNNLDSMVREANGDKFDYDVFMGNHKTTYQDIIAAKQTIKELYRYMIATDIITLIAIIVISKSFIRP